MSRKKRGHNTKDRIFDTAVELFGKYGLSGVSMDDIAEAVNIKASVIYNHYESKDCIFNEILSRFEEQFNEHLSQLVNENIEISSPDKILNNIFEKLANTDNMFLCYCISLIQKEQYNNIQARDLLFNLLFVKSVDIISSELNKVKTNTNNCDTRIIAFIIVFTFILYCNFRIFESMGVTPPINYNELHSHLKVFILDYLK